MLVLLGIGVLAGAITALSPCVLPVLPILLAGGASGRRPFAIVAGLVSSFTVFTLFAAWILGRLGLPQDTLRNLALALLFLLAATLLVPPLGRLLEKPFLPLTRRRGGNLGGGFLLGASLGLVFVPCAGPVLAAVTAVAATQHVNGRTAALTAAYAVGAAVPMLAVAAGGRAAAQRLRASAVRVRLLAGILIAATAAVIAAGLDTRLETALPGYTNAIQAKVEGKAAAALAKPALPTYGAAPDFTGVTQWLNSKPLSLKQLRGKVVLVDFWTYSCINCLRTLPHLEAWDAAYRSKGLVIVGVHTPEFAFEHVPANVEAAVRRYGVRYPVAIDNGYKTWNAWHNQYWPAEFLIDKLGRVRHGHFGEGDYGGTESAIRQLLGEPGPHAAPVRDATPTEETTPESYLGYARLQRYEGTSITPDRFADYRLHAVDQNSLSYGGRWKVERERIVAGPGARLALAFHARDVYLVLGGHGAVTARIGAGPPRRIPVAGDRLYTMRAGPLTDARLDLAFTPGVSAYAFTFG